MANLLLIDVSNLAHRIYHATAGNVPEDKVFVFARARLKKSVEALIGEVDPVRFVAAFDAPEKSFRYGLLDGYKGTRSEKPAALSQLLDETPAVFGELGAENLYAPHHEADDVIATVADQCLAVGGWRTVVVSNDGDLLSCAHDSGGGLGTYVLRNSQGAYQLWGPKQILDSPKYGVPPGRVTIFKALQGDKSDNIPGIAGIGPVMARRLALKYPNVKRLYAALDDPRAFTKGDRQKLESCGVERALLMEQVVRLVRAAPLRRMP